MCKVFKEKANFSKRTKPSSINGETVNIHTKNINFPQVDI